ncbi:MAG: type VI secretion system-associated protein TagF [Acidobacteriota bacterium]
MNPTVTTADLMYFGKLPCRGDFIRSTQHAPLLDTLDRWQSQSMDRLAQDPRWKLVYDAAPAMQFAVLGNKSTVGLAGTWIASQDASGRRFPFILAAAFDLPDPQGFTALSPVALNRLWTQLDQTTRLAYAASDLDPIQSRLNGALEFDASRSSSRAGLVDFLETHTVASLEQMLAAAGNRLSVRQSVLALGLLLQPVMAQGPAKLTKALCLPLVQDRLLRGPVASFWLSLVTGFFRRHEMEWGIFMVVHDGRPCMVLGFHGACAASMNAVMDPAVLRSSCVTVNEADWVEAEVEADYGLRKLSNYLKDPALSLAQALRTYEEVFLGL